MNSDSIRMPREDARKLIGAASPDAALLYIFILGGNPPEEALNRLNMGQSRYSCAAATLRQLGLWPEEKLTKVLPGERPQYSEGDVLDAMDSDSSFRTLYGEVQRLLGRTLNTEELKILLSFTRYLGFGADVISVLVCYCKDRARQKGSLRNPSLRTIEKEAYAWAERGIDTLEEAAAYIQMQNVRNSWQTKVMQVLQIRNRSLTPSEEQYAQKWLDMGFDEKTIGLAYDRTCLNTGNMNWAYMNKILLRWHEAGLHTVQEIQSGDRKSGAETRNTQRQLDADEVAAIRKLMEEG